MGPIADIEIRSRETALCFLYGTLSEPTILGILERGKITAVWEFRKIEWSP